MSQSSNDEAWDPRPGLEPEPVETAPDNGGTFLVELAGGAGMSASAALDVARRLELPGFTLDEEGGVIPLGNDPAAQTYIVRGHVADESVVAELERDVRIVKVWPDTPIAPF